MFEPPDAGDPMEAPKPWELLSVAATNIDVGMKNRRSLSNLAAKEHNQRIGFGAVKVKVLHCLDLLHVQ